MNVLLKTRNLFQLPARNIQEKKTQHVLIMAHDDETKLQILLENQPFNPNHHLQV